MKIKKSAPSARPSRLKRLTILPPALPSAIRYVDDFTDERHVIATLDANTWRLENDGTTRNMDFTRYREDANLLAVVKGLVADAMSKYAPSIGLKHLYGLQHLSLTTLVDFLETRPDKVRPMWDQLRAQSLFGSAYDGLKALLRYAAEKRLGQWTPLYLSFITASLPLPPTGDKFAAVRSGLVFLSVDEEAKLVRWIYEKAGDATKLSDDTLNDAALIVCNYQFAMRPKQIGMLRRRDCRIVHNVSENTLSVHLTFKMIKQKTGSTALVPLIRKIKREWAPLFAEIIERGKEQSGDVFLLGHKSAVSVSKRLTDLLLSILSTSRSATDLRHSGAMRQVDAGASAEELAEFMGHSSLETGLVYFDSSPTQAERVNQALGISETYQRLARLGKERFISYDELAALKGEQQIAGVPHGMPIAGIGGCETGQPSCPYNPVTACYGCPKFMPVNEVTIHKQVLANFREVVKFFYEASRGESESPAYLQLKRSIAEVVAVIDELENPDV
jgi:integrase